MLLEVPVIYYLPCNIVFFMCIQATNGSKYNVQNLSGTQQMIIRCILVVKLGHHFSDPSRNLHKARDIEIFNNKNS